MQRDPRAKDHCPARSCASVAARVQVVHPNYAGTVQGNAIVCEFYEREFVSCNNTRLNQCSPANEYFHFVSRTPRSSIHHFGNATRSE